MTSDYLLASELAKELGISTGEVLHRGNQLIADWFRKGGILAITGLSTGVRPVGDHTVATISPGLARLLREDAMT